MLAITPVMKQYLNDKDYETFSLLLRLRGYVERLILRQLCVVGSFTFVRAFAAAAVTGLHIGGIGDFGEQEASDKAAIAFTAALYVEIADSRKHRRADEINNQVLHCVNNSDVQITIYDYFCRLTVYSTVK